MNTKTFILLFFAIPVWDLETQELLLRTYLTHKTTYEYLSLFKPGSPLVTNNKQTNIGKHIIKGLGYFFEDSDSRKFQTCSTVREPSPTSPKTCCIQIRVSSKSWLYPNAWQHGHNTPRQLQAWHILKTRGSWNIQKKLDSDLFWAGDGRFCGGFPPLCILAPRDQSCLFFCCT